MQAAPAGLGSSSTQAPCSQPGPLQRAMLQVGWQDGQAVLALLQSWLGNPDHVSNDVDAPALIPTSGCLHLSIITAELPSREALERAWQVSLEARRPAEPSGSWFAQLLAQWPAHLPGLHRLVLLGLSGRSVVRLHVHVGEPVLALRRTVGSFDDLCVDPAWLHAHPGPLDEPLYRSFARLAAPWATATLLPATHTPAEGAVDRAVGHERTATRLREGLSAVGFGASGHANRRGKRRDGSQHRHPSGMNAFASSSGSEPKHVAIIGAGLAGAHVAAALTERGVRCSVWERHLRVARGGSAGPAGIVHGTVHRDDGVHARLLRACTLHAVTHYQGLLRTHPELKGAMEGLLRLANPGDSVTSLLAIARQQGLPAAWVRAVDAGQGASLAGVAVKRAGWWMPWGGWIDPAGVVAQLLADPRIQVRTGCNVARVQRDGQGDWQLLDEQGGVLVHAHAVVLTNAGDALRLAPHAAWPIAMARGQSTTLDTVTASGAAPHVPMSGEGYALTLPDGRVHCGASTHPNDPDPGVREADTRYNLRRLHSMAGTAHADEVVSHTSLSAVQSRVGWRATTPDRLPIFGAVPVAATAGCSSTTNRRHIARAPGCYVMTALGSRGLTLSPLLSQALAAVMLHEPVPLEGDLLHAMDAARYLARLPQTKL
jgi:tRNA 5-methylaminomethyl-2-thiouridine biosynthesis bifunctional protein